MLYTCFNTHITNSFASCIFVYCFFTYISEEIFHNDIDNCVGECPFVEGYVFENEQGILGYAMVAKSFSTEYGKPCIWIEDLYLKPECRGLGIGSSFFEYIEKKYDGALFRLEVEEENQQHWSQH